MDVEWKQVAKVLSAMFFEQTSRGLNESQLDFLAIVAFNEGRVRSFVCVILVFVYAWY